MGLTLDYIKSFKKDDKALFKALAEQGKTWGKLLQTHVFDSELTQEQRVEGEAVMNALIERRDRLDYQTYKEAIKALFPKADYHIVAREDGTPQENAWGFKLKYFWFDVYVGEKSLPSMTNSETPCVRIKVAAPGSRELTSDIDATISVHCLDHELLKEVKWPKALKVEVTEGSASSLIGWGVISYFNNLSFASLGVTSATSRDTNVYVDGFYKEHLEQGEPVYDADRSYPKFKMNPIITEAMEGIQEKRLLEEDLRNFYSANKKTKQTLELAASLVPLREYFDLEGRDWNINFTYTLVDETMDLPKEARQKYKNSIRSACSKADEFYQYKKTLLAEAEISNKDKEFLSKSDKSIDCMNELYAEHLLKLADINQKIYQQEAQIKIIQNKLKQNQEEIDELSEFLSGKDSDAIAKSRRLLKFQKELTAYREQSLTLHRKLESALKSLAKLYNEQQASQIRANLFAQEAYINRASVYHVVAWMQSAVDDLRINFKQVVMGSILQQIGFRLLHSAQFERAKMATGEILYRISKYGHRVGDMVYGDVNQPFDNQHAIKQKFDLKRTPVLRRLSSKTHTLKDSWHRIISQDIEFLLSVKKNPDIKIQKKGVTAVACYKKWVFSILYPDQYTKFLDGGFEPNDIPAYVAGKVSEANVTEWLQTDKQAWLDLARYIIVKAYHARFDDKKHFWGDTVMSAESSISLPSTASHGAESTLVSTLPQPSIHSDPDEKSQYQPQRRENYPFPKSLSSSTAPKSRRASLKKPGSLKPLVIGQSNFRRLIERGACYVDKTLFIQKLLDDHAKVKHFLRPRRFGKTLNMSMVYHFFASEVDGNPTGDLFRGLNIESAYTEGGVPCMDFQGKYPVIFLTFKDVKGRTFKEAYEEIEMLISKIYKKFRFIRDKLDLTNREREHYDAILNQEATPTILKYSLYNLSVHLYNYYEGKNVIILIDEYDTPILEGYMSGHYDEIVAFMREFFGRALKDNDYLESGILTGILRVFQEPLFADFNNTAVYSCLDYRYGDYFGFTKEEVVPLLQQYIGHAEWLGELKDWYGGYCAGKTLLFNPWSISKFLHASKASENKQLQKYWTNPTEKTQFKDFLILDDNLKRHEDLKSGRSDKMQTLALFKALASNQSIAVAINESTVFSEIKNNPSFQWSFLLLSGYLALERPMNAQDNEGGLSENQSNKSNANQYHLIIPNREVYDYFAHYFKDLFPDIKHFKFKSRGQTVQQSAHIYYEPYLELVYIMNHPELIDEVNKTLQKIGILFSKDKRKKCFISYAWPAAHYRKKQCWVQGFLLELYNHLRAAGLDVILDIGSQIQVGDLHAYTMQVLDSDYVLWVGTPLLYHSDDEAEKKFLCAQRDCIGQRYQSKATSNVIPILLQGTVASSFQTPIAHHPEFKMKLIDWQGKSYMTQLQKLLSAFYCPSGETAEFIQIWQHLYDQSPSLKTHLPEAFCSGLSRSEVYHRRLEKIERIVFECQSLNQVRLDAFLSNQKNKELTNIPFDFTNLEKQIQKNVIKKFNSQKYFIPALSENNLIFSASGSIQAFCLLASNKIAIALANKTIEIWDLTQRLLDCKLVRDSMVVNVLIEVAAKFLVCCSDDAMIEVWDLDQLQYLWKFVSHAGIVKALIPLPNNHIASCSHDGTIKIWNLDVGQCIKTLSDSVEIYSGIALTESLFIIGANSQIKIWNLMTESCEKILSGHHGPVNSLLLLSKKRLASSSIDGTIKIWDLISFECIHTLTGDAGSVCSFDELQEQLLMSGDSEGYVKIWDLSTRNCLVTIHVDNFPICALVTTLKNQVITVSLSGKVLAWEVTRRLIKDCNIEPLLDMLRNNTSLTDLNLSELLRTEESMVSFISLLEQVIINHPKLISINLKGIQFTEAEQMKLRKAIKGAGAGLSITWDYHDIASFNPIFDVFDQCWATDSWQNKFTAIVVLYEHAKQTPSRIKQKLQDIFDEGNEVFLVDAIIASILCDKLDELHTKIQPILHKRLIPFIEGSLSIDESPLRMASALRYFFTSSLYEVICAGLLYVRQYPYMIPDYPFLCALFDMSVEKIKKHENKEYAGIARQADGLVAKATKQQEAVQRQDREEQQLSRNQIALCLADETSFKAMLAYYQTLLINYKPLNFDKPIILDELKFNLQESSVDSDNSESLSKFVDLSSPSLEQLLSFVNNASAARKVAIVGQAGSGKSALCLKLLDRWLKEKQSSSTFKVVFFITVRNLIESRYPPITPNHRTGGYELNDILLQECFPTDVLTDVVLGTYRTFIKKCLSQEYSDLPTAFIIDACNELPPSQSNTPTYLQTLIDDLLQSSFPILVTTRPHFAETYGFDAIYGLAPLEMEHVEHYVKTFFKETPEKVENCLSLIEDYSLDNSDIKLIFKSPLYLNLLCLAVDKQTKIIPQHVSFTLQKIYFEKCIADLPQHMQAVADQLLHILAFETLIAGRLIFNESQVNVLVPQDTSFDCSLMVLFRKLPFIQRLAASTRTSQQLYTFTVHSIQEFLAANYLAQQFPQRFTQRFIRDNKFNPRFQVLIALTLSHMQMNYPKRLELCFEILQGYPNEVQGHYEVLLYIHCLAKLDITDPRSQPYCQVMLDAITYWVQIALVRIDSNLNSDTLLWEALKEVPALFEDDKMKKCFKTHLSKHPEDNFIIDRLIKSLPITVQRNYQDFRSKFLATHSEEAVRSKVQQTSTSQCKQDLPSKKTQISSEKTQFKTAKNKSDEIVHGEELPSNIIKETINSPKTIAIKLEEAYEFPTDIEKLEALISIRHMLLQPGFQRHFPKANLGTPLWIENSINILINQLYWFSSVTTNSSEWGEQADMAVHSKIKILSLKILGQLCGHVSLTIKNQKKNLISHALEQIIATNINNPTSHMIETWHAVLDMLAYKNNFNAFFIPMKKLIISVLGKSYGEYSTELNTMKLELLSWLSQKLSVLLLDSSKATLVEKVVSQITDQYLNHIQLNNHLNININKKNKHMNIIASYYKKLIEQLQTSIQVDQDEFSYQEIRLLFEFILLLAIVNKNSTKINHFLVKIHCSTYAEQTQQERAQKFMRNRSLAKSINVLSIQNSSYLFHKRDVLLVATSLSDLIKCSNKYGVKNYLPFILKGLIDKMPPIYRLYKRSSYAIVENGTETRFKVFDLSFKSILATKKLKQPKFQIELSQKTTYESTQQFIAEQTGSFVLSWLQRVWRAKKYVRTLFKNRRFFLLNKAISIKQTHPELSSELIKLTSSGRLHDAMQKLRGKEDSFTYYNPLWYLSPSDSSEFSSETDSVMDESDDDSHIELENSLKNYSDSAYKEFKKLKENFVTKQKNLDIEFKYFSERLNAANFNEPMAFSPIKPSSIFSTTQKPEISTEYSMTDDDSRAHEDRQQMVGVIEDADPDTFKKGLEFFKKKPCIKQHLPIKQQQPPQTKDQGTQDNLTVQVSGGMNVEETNVGNVVETLEVGDSVRAQGGEAGEINLVSVPKKTNLTLLDGMLEGDNYEDEEETRKVEVDHAESVLVETNDKLSPDAKTLCERIELLRRQKVLINDLVKYDKQDTIDELAVKEIIDEYRENECKLAEYFPS